MPVNRGCGYPRTQSMLVIAHAGHWLVSLAYFAPVIGFLVWLAVMQLRTRRADKNDG